jgi:hypothetical protein
MSQSSNSELPGVGNIRRSIQIGDLLCHSYATTLEVFLHRSIGQRYCNVNAVFGAGIIFVYCIAFPWCDKWPMHFVLGAYICMVLFLVFVRRQPGNVHSFYDGTPRLLTERCKWDEPNFKRFLEPWLIATIGVVAFLFNDALAWYLIGGAVSLYRVNTLVRRSQRHQELDLQDTVIEHEWLAESFRRRRDRSF